MIASATIEKTGEIHLLRNVGVTTIRPRGRMPARGVVTNLSSREEGFLKNPSLLTVVDYPIRAMRPKRAAQGSEP